MSATRTVLAGILIGLGLSLLIGSDARTSSPSFAAARQVMPIHVWGALAVVFGALLLVGGHVEQQARWLPSRVLAPGSAVLAAGWLAFWCAAFVESALQSPRAALTGIPVYGGLAVLALLVARREA